MTVQFLRPLKVGALFNMGRAGAWLEDLRFTPSVILLILVNVIPLIGVMVLGWDVGALLLLYWIETLIIGISNIPRMAMCQGFWLGKFFIIPFFCFHFGMFCFGHFAFLNGFFDLKTDGLMTALVTWDIGWFYAHPLFWAVVPLVFSHIFSFWVNFVGKAEYKGRDVSLQMFMPYLRIVIMHVVIIIGGILAQSLGQPIFALVLLIVLKTGFDLVAHAVSHDPKIMDKIQSKRIKS